MDLDDFQQDVETCDPFVEDLRSDDTNVKVHAVSKLYSIAEIIGKDRVKRDLLPQIVKIIEEKENEDEFLIQLAEQLGQFRNLLDKPDIYLLLPSLELLVSVEEPTVRDKAVQQIKLISEGQEAFYFSEYFFNMLKRFSSGNYSGQIAVCSLFAQCYPHVSDHEKTEIRQLFSDLCHHEFSLVRRAAAANLKNMVEVIEKHLIKIEIIPLFNLLVEDSVDSVKISAIENSVCFIPFYSKLEINDCLIAMLKNTDPELKSWRVRYALAETLTSFCNEIELEIVRKEIFPIYENLLKDLEPEVRTCALNKIPELFDKLSEDQFEANLIYQLGNLIIDTSLHVRLAAANLITKLCTQLRREVLLGQLLPLVQTLLKDEIIDVKIAAIKVLRVFNEKIGTDHLDKDILPLMEAIAREKQWRCRLSLTEAFPDICKGIRYETFRDKFADFMLGFLTDHYCAVREQTIDNIKKFIEIFGFEKLSEKVLYMLETLQSHDNYLFRIASLTTLSKLGDCLGDDVFQSLLESAMKKFEHDRVPNVRLILVQTIDKLRYKINNMFLESDVIPLLQKLRQDRDSDVAYFSKQVLKNLDK